MILKTRDSSKVTDGKILLRRPRRASLRRTRRTKPRPPAADSLSRVRRGAESRPLRTALRGLVGRRRRRNEAEGGTPAADYLYIFSVSKIFKSFVRRFGFSGAARQIHRPWFFLSEIFTCEIHALPSQLKIMQCNTDHWRSTKLIFESICHRNISGILKIWSPNEKAKGRIL